ncbi:MAG: hypothetical protein ACLTOU_04760 [Acutalibacter sp.]
MEIGWYFIIGYLAIINIITLVLYIMETDSPSPRLSPLRLISLPILGGSVGAVIANYFKDIEYRELRSWLHKILGYLPPVMFIIQLALIVSALGVENCIAYVWNHAYEQAGIIGCVLIVINTISFVLVIIRKSAYYIAPSGNYLIPDLILIPILILGGAVGGIIAKILFNFKEDWSCNATMEFQNFMYNWGMFLVAAVHIGLYIYFFIIR